MMIDQLRFLIGLNVFVLAMLLWLNRVLELRRVACAQRQAKSEIGREFERL